MKKVQQKRVRKRDFSGIIITLIGFLIGGALIGFGVYNNLTAPYNNLHIKSVDEMKQEVTVKNKKLDELRTSLRAEYDKSALSEEYEKLAREVSGAESELLDAEAELFNVQNGKYDAAKNNKIMGSVPLIILGAIVIVGTLSFLMYRNTRKKQNKILTIISDEKI